jgi:chromosome segregation ATPase
MKKQGAVAIAMAPFLSAVAVLIGAATVVGVQSESSTAQSSILQIRDTLHNLLRSIEDNGRDAEALSGKRQLWCDSNLHDFEAEHQSSTASLLDMQAQLTETEAEVEEAEGTVQQVKVDIEMVQHTIKQTQNMLEEHAGDATHKADHSLLQALLDNKHLSLSSLQGELEVAVPVLAQLQANVAETKQRVSYRSESLSVSKNFISSVRESCQSSADMSDSQAAARVSQTNSIQASLQGLPKQKDEAKADSDEKDDAVQALSFVQVSDGNQQEVTTDDLSDIFAADREVHPAAYADADEEPVAQTVTRPAAPKEMAAAPILRPRIQTLLSQLKDADSASSGRSGETSWCKQQHESSVMALKFAQDSVAQIGSELESHSDAEAEFGDALDKLQQTATAVTATAKSVLDQAGKEQALIQSSKKDQQLATKILDQAMTILKELDMPNSAAILNGLDAGKKSLLVQIKASAGAQSDSAKKAKTVSEMATAFGQTQESEQHNLEFARDDHAAQRLRGVENKRLYEADVTEAASYVQKLESSCSVDAENEAKQQRQLEVHALGDADKALDGKLVEAKSTASNLRGNDSSKPKPSAENMTPMQRAAMEMGISTD